MTTLSQTTIVAEFEKEPLSINESLSISRVFYTHLNDRSTFVVIYRYQNSSHVNGIETDLKVDQIIENKTLINTFVKSIFESLSKDKNTYSIRDVVKITNSTIEKEILLHEQ